MLGVGRGKCSRASGRSYLQCTRLQQLVAWAQLSLHVAPWPTRRARRAAPSHAQGTAGRLLAHRKLLLILDLDHTLLNSTRFGEVPPESAWRGRGWGRALGSEPSSAATSAFGLGDTGRAL